MKIKNIQLFNFLMILLIIISWNIIANYYFLRIDLTEEKRYTLSNATKKVLKTLDDQVYVEVFLDGDLPPGFKRLQKSIKEFLDETRIFARSKVQYTFSDPMASNDEATQQKFFSKLAQRGLQPTNIFAKENGKQTEKLIFPGAIVSYKGREIPINLLKSAAGVPPAEALNQSEEGIEFEIVSAINKLSSKTSKSIGFVQGHGELFELETKDIFDNLSESYNVERINLLNSNQLNENYHVLIIAKPTQYFSENEKIKLDQFVINGGNLILFIDKTNASLDQLEDGKTTAIALESNLEDLFFKFGFRLNPTLYQDAQCGMLPMVVGMQGNQPQTQLMPWMFYPVCTHFSNHPMVKNMSGVSTKFIGSIDTVKAVGITKTPIMFTSKYCKEIAVPCEINLMEARKQPNPAEFTKGQQPIAYLLEGKFKSLFTNRLTQSMEDSINFQSQKNEAKIIVFADGDIIKNEVLAKSNETLPLGFDRYLQKKLANKDLILNCIDYVCGGKDLIVLRAKELKLRPLDKNNIENKRTKWQIINVALPLVLLIIFGVLKYQRRLKKYSVW